MARGDECKTASKANYACKHLDVTAPVKKSFTPDPPKKQEVKKENYGAFGDMFKNKKHFTDMHFC